MTLENVHDKYQFSIRLGAFFRKEELTVQRTFATVPAVVDRRQQQETRAVGDVSARAPATSRRCARRPEA